MRAAKARRGVVVSFILIRTATPFIKLARGLGWYLIIQKEHSQCSGKIDLPNANIEKLPLCESS